MHGYKAKFQDNFRTQQCYSPNSFPPSLLPTLSTHPVFVSVSLFLPENFLRESNSFLIQITEKKEVDLMSSSMV